ncbi:MAG: Rhomboid family protein, partial [uncultured Solirubrobacteraceae bacterium]
DADAGRHALPGVLAAEDEGAHGRVHPPRPAADVRADRAERHRVRGDDGGRRRRADEPADGRRGLHGGSAVGSGRRQRRLVADRHRRLLARGPAAPRVQHVLPVLPRKPHGARDRQVALRRDLLRLAARRLFRRAAAVAQRVHGRRLGRGLRDDGCGDPRDARARDRPDAVGPGPDACAQPRDHVSDPRHLDRRAHRRPAGGRHRRVSHVRGGRPAPHVADAGARRVRRPGDRAGAGLRRGRLERDDLVL